MKFYNADNTFIIILQGCLIFWIYLICFLELMDCEPQTVSKTPFLIYIVVKPTTASVDKVKYNPFWYTRASGVYILQMTYILFPGRTGPAPKIFAIEGNPTSPN